MPLKHGCKVQRRVPLNPFLQWRAFAAWNRPEAAGLNWKCASAGRGFTLDLPAGKRAALED